MGTFRKLLLVAAGAVALQGVQACASDTELNPQPLPPSGEPTRAPEGAGNDDQGSATDLGGGTGAPPADAADGGTEGGDGGSGDGGTG